MGGAALSGKRIKSQFVPQIVEDFMINLGIPDIPYYICGSFRRGKPDCGDIEIVFNINEWNELLFETRQRIAKSFGYTLEGNPKMQGLWGEIQFDLFIANDSQLGAMIMHATGSGQFNIKMRAIARMRGLKLNQYGLFRQEQPVVLGREEKPIFDYLGVRYHEPKERI